MPQSLVKVYLHIISSTKNRLDVLAPGVQPALYDYIVGICNHIKIGGHTDHMHILCMAVEVALLRATFRARLYGVGSRFEWLKPLAYIFPPLQDGEPGQNISL